MHIHAMVLLQRTTGRGHFSPTTVWVPGIKVQPAELAASNFACFKERCECSEQGRSRSSERPFTSELQQRHPKFKVTHFIITLLISCDYKFL